MSKGKPPNWPKLTQRQMADLLAITETRMEWGYRRKIVTRESGGLYRPEIVVGQWLAYERGPRARSRGRVSSEFEKQRARLVKARATAAERQAAVLDGSLVSGEGIVETVKTVCMRIRAKLQAALPRLARSCYHAPSVNEALKNARSEFDAVIDELSALEDDGPGAQFEVVNDEGGNGSE